MYKKPKKLKPASKPSENNSPWKGQEMFPDIMSVPRPVVGTQKPSNPYELSAKLNNPSQRY